MKRVIYATAYLSALLLSAACAGTPQRPTLTKHGDAHEKTLAHVLLEREHHLAAQLGVAGADEIYRRAEVKLDALLRRAEMEIHSLPPSKRPTDVLLAIERALVAEDFILHIPTEFLVDTLTARVPNEPMYFLTKERRRHFMSASPARVYEFDCDTGSFLYMAVAERVELPLRFVEIPHHNFVRWVAADGTTLNWDVNEATTYTDQQYVKEGTLTASPVSMRNPERAHYLVSFTRLEIEGYHHYLLAQMAERAQRVDLAEAHYLEAIRLRPAAPGSKNALAWLWSVHPSFSSAVHGARAVEFAEQAVAAVPEEPNYLDTLSCALAAAGRFDEATEVEHHAENKESRLARYARHEDCHGLESL